MTGEDTHDPEDNAFIRALPPSRSGVEWADKLRVKPMHAESDRLLPYHMRRERVARLRRYFKPSTKHVRFIEQLRLLVREGYVGRRSDPASRDARMLELARGADGALLAPARPIGVRNRAGSAGFFGFSGMGKSLMVEHALDQFDQRVPQEGADQIVWLKLDCPPDGSLRELCIKFFREVDRVLGREFFSKICAGHTASEQSMLIDMQRVAAMHALGVLVIDEIQHLPSDGEDEHRLLTFLVNLVNDIGVPVLFVGTMKAKEVVGRSDTLSRRMVGLGGAEWDRLRPRADGQKGEWERFLEHLWSFQWTAIHTELTDDIREALWDETQGVVDLLVKLFCLVQMRVILKAEGEADKPVPTPELITADKIREVAFEEMGAVRPMIMALRHGAESEARRFGDYGKAQKALHDKIGTYVAPEIVMPEDLEAPVEAPVVDAAEALAEQVAADELTTIQALVRQGHTEDRVRAAVRRAKASLGDRPATLPNLLPVAMGELDQPSPEPLEVANDVDGSECEVAGDLRAIAREAVAAGRPVYDLLCADGLAGPAAARRIA